MKIYPTRQAVYDDCSIEERFEVIAQPVHNEAGELVGYVKYYI